MPFVLIILVLLVITTAWLRIKEPVLRLKGVEIDYEFLYVVLTMVQVTIALSVIYSYLR